MPIFVTFVWKIYYSYVLAKICKCNFNKTVALSRKSQETKYIILSFEIGWEGILNPPFKFFPLTVSIDLYNLKKC